MTTRRVFLPVLMLLVVALLLAGAAVGAQESSISLELSGVNAIDLPRAEVTVNVYDALGQPINGLTAENFRLSGPLSNVATITRVENLASNELPFGTVLVIDASESMAGEPIELAKAAALAYIDNTREIDPIAVVAFGSTVELIQDFTTDRDALRAAIDSIALNGRTALYQAAYDGIEVAKNSPVSRRTMVLLSDGSEYGGLSTVTPDEVIENAFLHGVPTYSVGLGYGAERSFLERLSTETLGQFFETPTADELSAIYQALADRLSSQYILSLDVNAPLDGTEYPFALTVEVDGATANQLGSVRAPIPVPIVDLSSVPAEPISEVTDLEIVVNADQDITSVTTTLGGEPAIEQTTPPYLVQIDPALYPPGPLVLDVTATDVDGETGSASATLEIAALPSVIALSSDVSELGEIDEPLEITISATGQTAPAEVRISLNGGDPVILEPPFSFTLDPLQLPPGDNQLEIVVVNEAGVESVYSGDFIVADVPPTVALAGVSDGQSVDAPTSFTVDAVGQTPVTDVVVTLNGVPLEPVDGVYTIDPMTVPPGAAELVITATTDRGQTTESSVTVMIAPLPPVVSVEGLEDGDSVSGEVTITLDATTQTPVNHGMVTVNGVDVAHPVSLPATITLPLSAMQPGENEVEIVVDTAGGQTGSTTLTFTAPASLFTPTPTNTPTPNQTATAQAVTQAAATRTAVAQAALDAAATSSAGTQIAATESAQISATQGASTAQAQTSATAQAATQGAQAASTQSASTQSAATQNVQATQTQAEAAAGSATQAVATQSAATQAAATQAAQVQATQAAATTVAQAATADPSATPVAPTSAPATSAAPATAQAAAAFVRQAATSAAATVAVQVSATLQAATETAVARATQAEQQAATQQIAATESAQISATQGAATQRAQATAAQAVVVTQAAGATGTSQARATTQAETNQTATALSQVIVTATAQAGRTATLQAESTSAARAAATSTSQANSAATASAATADAATASAQSVAQTATTGAERQTATAGAQATRTERAVLAAASATAAATPEPTEPPTLEPTAAPTVEATAEAQSADATPTIQPTLTPVEVESQAGGGATNGLWVIFVVIILLAVGVVVLITRARKRRYDQ